MDFLAQNTFSVTPKSIQSKRIYLKVLIGLRFSIVEFLTKVLIRGLICMG